jgi:hypothetical protein
VCGRPGIGRAAPEGIDALKGEERLGDVRLGEDDGACCAERRDDLWDGLVRGVGRGLGKTYGGIALGWLVSPLRITNRTVEPLDVDYSI